MKKLYLRTILAALLLTITTNINAAVTSMADLFGKYAFTATVEITEDGEALKEHFAAESEVVITKDANGIFDAQITGFAGAKGSEAMKVNSFSAEKNAFAVRNPNGSNYGVFTGGVYYSEADGKYPFGETQLSDLVFTFNPETQEITVPDFTIIGNCDWAASTCKVLARYTNVKMTLVESENIIVPDISGEWTVKGGGDFGTKEGSVLPAEYLMTLAQNGDAKTYTATFTIEGIAPFTLDATFDGNTLSIPFNNKCVDETNGWYIVNMYSNNPLEGTITFTYSSEKAMPSANPLVIGKQTGDEDAPTEFIQWWMNGSAKKNAGTEAFDWAGEYTLKSKDFMDFSAGADVMPAEGDMVITYNEASDAYYVTTLLGFDIYDLNLGGLKLTPSEDDPNVASIAIDGGYGTAYIKSSEDYSVWYCIKDANGGKTPLTLTRNEDGTFKLSDFFIAKGAYGEENTYIASIQNNVVTAKQAEVPVWEGEYKATAKVTKYADVDCPETFDIVIDPAGDYGQFVTTFITADAKAANYGGIKFTPSDSDADKAEMKSNMFVKTVQPGVEYWKIKDMNGSDSPISYTRNADGTISISSFSLWKVTFDESYNEVNTCLALYEDVTATKQASGIGQVVSGNNDGTTRMYDIMGRQLDTDINSMKGKLVIIKTANGTRKVLVK